LTSWISTAPEMEKNNDEVNVDENSALLA